MRVKRKLALAGQSAHVGALRLLIGCALLLLCGAKAYSCPPGGCPSSAPRRPKVRYRQDTGVVLDLNGDGVWELSLKGMAFARFEGQTNRSDMSFDRDDSDGYIASRIRLGVGVRLLRHIFFKVTLQDARFWGSGLPSSGRVRFNSQSDSQFGREVFLGFSMFEGYVALERPWDLPFKLEVGRMVLEYGRGFVLGDPAYAVQGQSFDTVRLRWLHQAWKVDLFWAKIRALVEVSDGQTCAEGCVFEGDDLVSLYGVGQFGKSLSVDLYAMFYHRAPHNNEAVVDSNIAIVGGRLDWRSSQHKVGLEVIGETGSWQGELLLAFVMLLEASYTFPGTLQPTIGFQGLVGSGDRLAGDGVRTSFQPLLSRRRRFYGMLGLFAPSNLIQPTLILSIAPHKTLKTSVNVRQSFLWSPQDALLSGGHTLYAQNPNGKAQVVGMEVNLSVEWKPFPFLLFDLVGGVFLPQVGDYFSELSTTGTATSVFGNQPALLGYFRSWLSF